MKGTKMLALIMALVMIFNLVGVDVAAAALGKGNGGLVAANGDLFPKNMTATPLDENFVTNVTMSVGGMSVSDPIDVIFLLGGGMQGNQETVDSAIEVFRSVMESGLATVRMGIISLEKGQEIILDLNSDEAVLNPETYEEFIAAQFAYMNSLPAGTTNLHSQLLEAQKMLEKSSTKPENQYLFMIATGRTYWFDDANGEQATIVGKTGKLNNGAGGTENFYYYGNYTWQSLRGKNSSLYMIPDKYNNDYAAFMADIEKWVKADGDQYVYTPHFDVNDYSAYKNWYSKNSTDWRNLYNNGNGTRYGAVIIDPKPTAENFTTGTVAGIPYGENNHAMNYERAQYECVQVWKQLIASGYNCYSICSESPNYQNGSEYIKQGAKYTGTSTTQLGHSFMNYMATLAGQKEAPTVWDYERDAEGNMLSTKTVLDKNFFQSITDDITHLLSSGSYVENYIGYVENDYNFDFLTDGTVTLKVGNTTYITKKLENPVNGATASYIFTNPEAAEATFTLDYYYGNGTTTEKFVWGFGENVYNHAPLTLSFQQLLVEKQEEVGKYDAYVSQTATLYPVDSKGVERDPEDFIIPLVEYENVMKTVTVTVEGTKYLNHRLAEGYRFWIADEAGNVVGTATSDSKGKFSFELTFDEAGDYKYQIGEIEGNKDNIAYDETVYEVIVHVTKNGGKMEATVEGAENIVFTNLALSTTATIGGFKNLNGIATGNFQFELRDQNHYLVDTAISNEQGIFTFKTLTFAQTGTYTYYVNEVIGNDENMCYDNSQYKVIVKVERVGDELVATMRYELNGAEVENVTFNNKTVAAAEVIFGGNKYMNGKLTGGYEFQLKNENGQIIETVMSDENGKFTFTALQFAQAGTYKFQILEVKGTDINTVYDKTVYEVTVNVERQGDKLVATVSGAENIEFHNVSVTGTEATIGGSKYMDGKLTGGYEFQLKDENGNVIETVMSNENGLFTFTALQFTQVGTYKYQVVEVKGNEIHTIYDETVFEVIVSVNRIGDELVATVTGAENIAFNNKTISGTEATIGGSKYMDGKLTGGYEFQLKDENGNVIETVMSNENGLFTFTALQFTQVGTYKYQVVEVKGNEIHTIYDETVFEITVIVERIGNELIATVSGAENIEFHNQSVPGTEVVISGDKYMDGKLTGGYEFQLKDENGNVIETVMSNENGLFTFTALQFTQVGTYKYQVVEVKGNEIHTIYDETVFEITVIVERIGNELIATVSGAENIEFHNQSVPGTEVVISGDKYMDGKLTGGYEFQLKDENGNVIETVMSNENGLFTFTALQFTQVGTYKYQVVEVKGNEIHTIYDETVFEITVIVERIGNELIATVSGAENIEFHNQSVPGTEVVISGDKYMDGKLTGGYEFQLKDENGNVIETVMSNENGLFTFTALQFTQVGTYKYQVVEVKGNEIHTIYDETVFEITVIVERIGNELIATVSGAENIEFHNQSVPGTEVIISGEKYLDGDLADGFWFSIMHNGQVIETVTSENGKFTFSALQFAEAGEYTFQIFEVLGDDEDIIYDETVYEVTIVVERIGNELIATVSGAENIEFYNETVTIITPPTIPEQPGDPDENPKTGDAIFGTLLAMTISLATVGTCFLAKRKEN